MGKRGLPDHIYTQGLRCIDQVNHKCPCMLQLLAMYHLYSYRVQTHKISAPLNPQAQLHHTH